METLAPTEEQETESTLLRFESPWPEYLVVLGMALAVNLWWSSKLDGGLYPLIFAGVTFLVLVAWPILVIRHRGASPLVGCVGVPLLCLLTFAVAASGTPLAARVSLSRLALNDAAREVLMDETSETSIERRPVVGQLGRFSFDTAKRCGDRVVFAVGDGWSVEGLVSNPSQSWDSTGISWEAWNDPSASSPEINCFNFQD